MSEVNVTFSIPAYNDADALRSLLEEILLIRYKYATHDYPVLIIDDCSSDNTLDVALDFADQHQNVQVIRHSKNYGFGLTFKEAFNLPKTDWVFFLTGDNQFPAENILTLQRDMGSNDIVIGRRAKRKDNLTRRINSKIYNMVISVIAGSKITDVNSTILFKKEILSKIELSSQSAFVNAEFLLKAIKSGYSFTETDVVHKERLHGVGSGGRISVIFPVIGDVLRYIFGKL
jgi:glycosyltransferase involved in cell wall biosynthesis